MATRHTLADIGFRIMSGGHRAILRATGGRVLDRALGMQMVELHTIGRVSGQPRSTMLAAPIIAPDRVVLVASKGGDARDPDWFRNLLAHPDVDLTVSGQRRPMRARQATPEEKATLWPEVVAAYRGYASYQRRTTRDIPLVILAPR
jgi:deazaflavin-dependent oxidoreductase (nitroreductase family)